MPRGLDLEQVFARLLESMPHVPQDKRRQMLSLSQADKRALLLEWMRQRQGAPPQAEGGEPPQAAQPQQPTGGGDTGGGSGSGSGGGGAGSGEHAGSNGTGGGGGGSAGTGASGGGADGARPLGPGELPAGPCSGQLPAGRFLHQRVSLVGLVKKPELNGRHGVAVCSRPDPLPRTPH